MAATSEQPQSDSRPFRREDLPVFNENGSSSAFRQELQPGDDDEQRALGQEVTWEHTVRIARTADRMGR